MANLFELSKPRSRDAHILRDSVGAQLFVPEGSQLFDIDEALADTLARAWQSEDDGTSEILVSLGLDPNAGACQEKPVDVRTRALSLAVAQSCNLGCGYCYAQGGTFGSSAKAMDIRTALAAVDLLLAETHPGERANLAYLGGEPLAGRDVIHASANYAAEKAAERGIKLGFSITTNGTLISERDIDLFDRLGFAVTISLDGIGSVHDRLRSFKGGAGSYDRILARIAPLLERQGRCQVSARVTVTPENLALEDTLDHFVAIGFHTVGFSPMLSAPNSMHEMQQDHLASMLEQMVACGRAFERKTLAGERYPFANLLNALREIHKGTHRPYPCGAGAGYLGVSADGELGACHRFVGEPDAVLGTVADGVDRVRQAYWLSARHVHAQTGCPDCWARYLCAGGCHHETLHRGRPACDFIRGWLHYAITAYGRLSKANPSLFADYVR
ncbi:SPASM domain-containing protein [Rhizobium leguminosarum]|uniref:radical SAM/SPASM domain-containing protein n=1 Tax=Rhizobium leguminosarum TaxID=384 RepID=UPI001C919B9B|nr:radical SAM protein [Rhizobium leguminosarum]MBY3031159.1 SPASM domain-containing protein [Rhizobium leguminosarum]